MDVSRILTTISEVDCSDNDEQYEDKWYRRIIKRCVPTQKQLNIFLTQLFIGVLFCLLLYGMLGKHALPGSSIFAIFLLALFALIGGKLIRLIGLPPLLGMLLVGFIFRNLKANPYYKDIDTKTADAIKEAALAYILLRAGLALDPSKLKELKWVVLRLVLVPCAVEASSMGVLSHYLMGLPWLFSFMLGWIMSAISAEVVIPIMIDLDNKGYGTSKGVPTLIMAATSLDDILAIVGFSICFSIAFSTSDLTWTIVKAPLEPLVGCAYGAVVGVIFWHFPAPKMKTGPWVYYSTLLVSFGAMVVMFLTGKFNIPAAGPIGCVVLGFMCALRWRKMETRFLGVEIVTNACWKLAEPFLFSLIGTEVTIETLRDNAAFGTLCIILALLLRGVSTILCCFGTTLNCKEKVYVFLAWIPKATVQAAVGAQALNYARANKLDKDMINYGSIVLNICVLSICLTAPFGAVTSSVLGPLLLSHDRPPTTVQIPHFYNNPSGAKPSLAPAKLVRDEFEALKSRSALQQTGIPSSVLTLDPSALKADTKEE